MVLGNSSESPTPLFLRACSSVAAEREREIANHRRAPKMVAAGRQSRGGHVSDATMHEQRRVESRDLDPNHMITSESWEALKKFFGHVQTSY